MNRPIVSFVVLLLLCSEFAFSPNCEAQSNPDRRFRVGFILSLTGSWAEFGTAQNNALILAREENPELFTNIDMIVEDCGHQGKEVINAFQKLTAVDKVNAVFVWGVEPALIAAPVAESRKIPLIASAQAAPASRGRKYVIRTLNYSEQYSKKLLDYFRAEGLKKIGMAQAEMSYYNLLIEGIRKNLAPDEELEVVDTYVPAAADFNTTIIKLKTKNFDTLGLYLTPPQILEFYREAAAQQFHPLIFGTHPFQSKRIVADAGGLMNGAIYVHNIVTESFQERYSKRFHDDNQIPWAANAYDAAILFGKLFNSGKETPDADRIIELFSNIGTQDGAGGTFRYQNTEDGGKFFEYPIGVFRIEGDKHVRIM